MQITCFSLPDSAALRLTAEKPAEMPEEGPPRATAKEHELKREGFPLAERRQNLTKPSRQKRRATTGHKGPLNERDRDRKPHAQEHRGDPDAMYR